MNHNISLLGGYCGLKGKFPSLHSLSFLVYSPPPAQCFFYVLDSRSFDAIYLLLLLPPLGVSRLTRIKWSVDK